MVGCSLAACAASDAPEPFGIGGGAAETDGADDAAGTSGGADDAEDPTPPAETSGDAPGDDDGADPDAGDSTGSPVALQACTYESTSFGEGLLELDVMAGSSLRLSFSVPGLPDPELVESATLRFDSYDADHPGEEGLVYVGGGAPLDLPANAAWDNTAGSGTIDVSGLLVEGTNTVEFGAGPLERSFFQIGNVALDVDAYVEDCQPAPDGPMGNPVPRQVDYQDATYTMRHNWVLRCDDYAFTAYGDEHLGSDCDDLYDPDGSRLGTATFSFPDLEAGTYEIQIRSRHTENRNPEGALFVVDGEGKRISQRDDANYTTDIWGTRDLAGDVTVVLDSSQEGQSDSVIWVRLEPS